MGIEKNLVIGIDSSTQSTKAIAWNAQGRAVAEGRAHGKEPEYRIGIWRVLAKATYDPQERRQWTSRIRDVFLDTNAPDRLHALRVTLRGTSTLHALEARSPGTLAAQVQAAAQDFGHLVIGNTIVGRVFGAVTMNSNAHE